MIAKVFEPKFVDATITEITLLSIEEAEKLPEHILELGEWWWLRSPGGFYYSAGYIAEDGSIYAFGYDVDFPDGAVRPVLRINNLESLNLKVGDAINVAGYYWTIITEDLALCNVAVGNTCFRQEWAEMDSNNYETSDIKVWLENWARENCLEIEETGKESEK